MSNNDPLSEIIYSTVDFFLDFPKEVVDEIYDLLAYRFASWSVEQRGKEVNLQYRRRARIFQISEDQTKPWDTDDYRIQSPIDLLDHLWLAGEFRDRPPMMIFALRAAALTMAMRYGATQWRDQILSQALLLQYAQKKIYKLGIKNLKDYRDKQISGLKQNPIREIFLAHEKAKLESIIHSMASRLLREGKNKRDIVSLIEKAKYKNLNGRPFVSRDVRRYLESHESGNWVPKKKK